LGDRWFFEPNGPMLELAQLDAAYRQQLFLPEANGAPPPLPRMHFRFGLPGGPVREVELDAYKFVSLLIELEPDPSRRWNNGSGQSLSVEQLLDGVREHYLAGGGFSADPPDHSELHLIELLTAYGRDLPAVQRHFVDVDLAARALEPKDAS